VMSDHFDTRVRVDQGKSKGRITIEFATPEDLERIVVAMRLHQSNDLSV
jgi:ParB family transcriptional regulator, chromosome partitioning protein